MTDRGKPSFVTKDLEGCPQPSRIQLQETSQATMLRKTKESKGAPLETFFEVKGHLNLTHFGFESANRTAHGAQRELSSYSLRY